MTNKELVTRFLDYYGLRQVKGEPLSDGELLPLVPFLFADAGQTYYRDYIQPLNTQQMAQKHRNRWQESYSEFMHYLFRPFGDKEEDAVIEKMDEFEAFIANDLLVTQVAYMNCVQDSVAFENQQVVSAALMCNVLAQLAEVVWNDVFRRFPGRAYTELHGIRVHAREFTRHFLSSIDAPETPVPDKYRGKLEDAVEVLTNKIVKWLVKETNTTYNNFRVKRRASAR